MTSGFAGSLAELRESARERMYVWTATALIGTWMLIVSVLFVLLATFYRGPVVDAARARYAASTAARVGSEAAGVLSSALSVRDAVNYAVMRKLWYDPMDYAAVRQALEPVFAAAPALRSVDLAFTDRTESITMRRRWGHLTEDLTESDGTMIMQSDANDCLTLGPLGCFLAARARDQPWYHVGFGIGGSSPEDFQWVDGPLLIEEHGRAAAAANSRYGYGVSVAWAPAYSLVFRTVFPGTSGRLSVIGRVTLEIGSLRDGRRLFDASLGSESAIYVCDRLGILVATVAPGMQAKVSRPSGQLTFRHIRETGDAWVGDLQVEDFAGRAVRRFDAGDFHVVVAPVPGRGLSHFSVVLASCRTAFVDDVLDGLSKAMDVLVGLPHASLFIVFVGYQISKEMRRRRADHARLVREEGARALALMTQENNKRRENIGTAIPPQDLHHSMPVMMIGNG